MGGRSFLVLDCSVSAVLSRVEYSVAVKVK